jgi:hypothetical protein
VVFTTGKPDLALRKHEPPAPPPKKARCALEVTVGLTSHGPLCPENGLRILMVRTSAAPSAASTGSYVNIDETHAVHLARHLADLYERGRFTDLRVRHLTTALPERTRDCSTRPNASALTFKYAPRCGAARSCSRCTRAW